MKVSVIELERVVVWFRTWLSVQRIAHLREELVRFERTRQKPSSVRIMFRCSRSPPKLAPSWAGTFPEFRIPSFQVNASKSGTSSAVPEPCIRSPVRMRRPHLIRDPTVSSTPQSPINHT